MEQIGMPEAEARLSELADQVRRTGRSVTITNRGEPYVDLVPHQPAVSWRAKADVIADLDEFRKQLPQGDLEQIKADLAEGRR